MFRQRNFHNIMINTTSHIIFLLANWYSYSTVTTLTSRRNTCTTISIANRCIIDNGRNYFFTREEVIELGVTVGSREPTGMKAIVVVLIVGIIDRCSIYSRGN